MDIRERLRVHRRSRLRNEYDDQVVNTWIGPINTQLYGEGLQTLCHRTSENIERLKINMSQTDPCYEYGMKHWHADQRPKSAMSHTGGYFFFIRCSICVTNVHALTWSDHTPDAQHDNL